MCIPQSSKLLGLTLLATTYLHLAAASTPTSAAVLTPTSAAVSTPTSAAASTPTSAAASTPTSAAAPTPAAASAPYYPPQWSQMCTQQLSPRSGGAPSAVLVDLRCSARKSDPSPWKLNDLRSWVLSNSINNLTTPTNRTVEYNISVTCEPGANISLPWPMRVPGLRELHVTSCRLLDQYINFQDGIDSEIGDDMKFLEMRHCTYVETSGVEYLQNSGILRDLTSDFNCGQDSSMETYISSNVSQAQEMAPDLTANQTPPTDRAVENRTQILSDALNLPPEEPERGTKTGSPFTQIGEGESMNSRQGETTTMANLEDELDRKEMARIIELELIKMRREMEKLSIQCNYEHLRVLDESVAVFTHLNHFETMTKFSRFPLVETLNYSSIGLRELPQELAQWRTHFPKLQLLDLSDNQISQVRIPNSNQTRGEGVVTFDLRFNNITTVSLDILNSWASLDDLFLDIKDNPIDCGCEIASLVPQLGSSSAFVGRLEPYLYVRSLRCHSPEGLRGRELHTLTTESLDCPAQRPGNTRTILIITLCIALVTIIIVIAIVVKFKLEIRILLYTRCHVQCTCGTQVHKNTKPFDAFVSYSDEDRVWVLENLVKILENPTNENPQTDSRTSYHSNDNKAAIGQRYFRLCLHQRDFVPGKPIMDNIVDCIQASRHTIIVLSPSFMRSQWAMEELRRAYSQSLAEKTRHLIIIRLKKVPNDGVDPLVRCCCKAFTYLDAGDSLFRDRLLFSLATKSGQVKRTKRCQRSWVLNTTFTTTTTNANGANDTIVDINDILINNEDTSSSSSSSSSACSHTPTPTPTLTTPIITYTTTSATIVTKF